MIPQLADVANQFRAISERARALIARVGESRITQRPEPGRWSIAECLIHLRITSEAYFPTWQEALANARAQRRFSDGPFKMDFMGRVLTWWLEPPSRLRMKAPANFQPPPELGPAAEILPAFLKSQDRLLEAVAEADGLALDRLKIASPFDRRMRYSVWSSFCGNAAHQRRHLWQAEHVFT
jgi:hypothetical protein